MNLIKLILFSDSENTIKELPLQETFEEAVSNNCTSELSLKERNEAQKELRKKKNNKDNSDSGIEKNSPIDNTFTQSMSDRLRNRRYYPSSALYGGSNTALPLATSSASSSSGRYRKSSTTAAFSALDRLCNNLSPVSSYYKPLLRTFGSGKGTTGTHDVSIQK